MKPRLDERGLSPMRKTGAIAVAVVVSGLLALAVPSGQTTLAAAVEGYIGGLGVSGTSYEVVRQTESEAEVIVYLEITEDGQTQRVPKENLLLRKDANGNWGVAQATAIIIPPEILAAVDLTTPHSGNPAGAAGDNVLVIRHEYGEAISHAVTLTAGSPEDLMLVAEAFDWNEMELKINGETALVALLYLTSNGEVKVDLLTPDLNLDIVSNWVWPATEADAGAMDFAVGDMMVVMLVDESAIPKPLESSDLIQLVWVSRDLMLVEYLVQ